VEEHEREFEEWVRARTPTLARSAFLLTGDVHGAEDLVQDTLVRIADHWHKLHRTGSPDAYARQVMHRLSIDRWRRRRVRVQEVAHDEAGLAAGVAVTGPDEAAGDRILVGQALGRLTPKQRAVLMLRFHQDLSERETAEVLGCSISTVKSQTRVALARIRELAPDILAGFSEEERS
jgi:RNA polymerase sigma-70 factor (sigma-E family)